MNLPSKPVANAIAAIDTLDLDPIKLKLMDAEEGQGWSRDYVERTAIAYKRYLTLLVKFPEESIAPTKDVDKFWHAHILDTQKYAVDCQAVFGYFLHHFPYFGMRGESDAADLRAAAANMHAIYEREFGESLPNGAAWCTAAEPAQRGNAWCTSATPLEHAGTAWCTAAKPQANAWCTAARPEAGAWCTAARPGQAAVDVSTRPALPAAT